MTNHVSYPHKDWRLQHFGGVVVLLTTLNGVTTLNGLPCTSLLIIGFFRAFSGALLLTLNQRDIPAAQLGASTTPDIPPRLKLSTPDHQTLSVHG